MTALAEREVEKTAARPFLLATLGLLVLAVPIICHGCHAGDHDDELSVPLSQEPRTK